MALGDGRSAREAIADAIQWVANGLDRLGHLLDPVGEILGKLLAPALAIVAAVVLLRVVRWLLLIWRGRTPRVQISPFSWAISDAADREATWVTSLFREQLSALRLDALDPLPERAPGAPLVEIVEGVGQGVGRDIGAAAGRLFKAIWPDSAYEVWGTLRPQEDGRGRISVQLIERRRGNRTLLNVALKDADWEEGAREAAMAVAGALYPRVRKRDRGPWTLWERSVPRKLMGHYHDARRFEEDNRLEHALAAYHAALELDPLNPNLRLKIAMLQERMELYLDAWVTYEAIVDESNSRAWRGPDRRIYLLALYRLAVMLSNGCVAAKWVKTTAAKGGVGGLRDEERQERRRDLMLSLKSNPLFKKQFGELSPDDLLERHPRAISSLIRNLPADTLMAVLRWLAGNATKLRNVLDPFEEDGEQEGEAGKAERERRIEAVLQILGLRRLEELETAQRRLPLRPRNWREGWFTRRAPLKHLLSRPEFGRSAVRTSKLLVRTRIAASLESQVKRRAERPGGFDDRGRWIEEIREAHLKMTKRWPFPPVSRWRSVFHWIAPRRRWENRREDAWQLYYNAACVTASMLRDESVLDNCEKETGAPFPQGVAEELCPLPFEIDKERIARGAIDQLEEYAFRAGSDRVAAQADWVAIDDPDLNGLRDRDDFTLWASHHLPLEIPKGRASCRADVKRFTIRVMREGARSLAIFWRERAAHPNPPAGDLVDWWRAEAKMWEALGNACREHLSWQERLKWLRMLQVWLRATKREDEVDFGYEARGAAADSMSENLFRELALLAGEKGSGNRAKAEYAEDPCALLWVGQRVQHVRVAHEAGEERADAEGTLREEAERDEVLRAARVWTRLAESLDLELRDDYKRDSDEELRRRMARIREEFASAVN
jgi:hypothetical protein